MNPAERFNSLIADLTLWQRVRWKILRWFLLLIPSDIAIDVLKKAIAERKARP